MKYTTIINSLILKTVKKSDDEESNNYKILESNIPTFPPLEPDEEEIKEEKNNKNVNSKQIIN